MTQLEYDELYRALQAALRDCASPDVPFAKEIESCFGIAMTYWNRLVDLLARAPGWTRAEEIHFFKTIKPMFRSEIEYYNLIYHTVLFQPFDHELSMNFWRREVQRLDKFRSQHVFFYEYYSQGRTNKDHRYFLVPRAQRNAVGSLAEGVTQGDGLLTTLLALQRYTLYATERLEQV